MHAFNQPGEKLHAEEKLEKLANEVSNHLIDFVSAHLPEAYQNLKIEYVIKSDLASNAILDSALDEDIDLIVMGMTGKTNALDSLFGSTTLDVLAGADCSVLMIPADVKFEGIDNLVYTTNFEFRDLGAIHYLKKWSKILDSTIHCLHIIEDKINEGNALKNMNILKAVYKNHKRILFDMMHGDFQEEIAGFAKKKQADIVAMISHKRNFIERLIAKSEVKGVARHIHIPLLVIKDNAYEMDNPPEWLEIVSTLG